MSEENKLPSLPPPADNHAVATVPEYANAYPAYAYGEPEPEADAVPLSHYLWILKRQAWKILALVVVTTAATVIISSRLTPIYEATATIDVDRQMPSTAVGEDTQRAPNDAEQFLATQIKLIQSDSVLRPVVQRYRLNSDEVETLRSKIPTATAEDAPVALKRLKVTRPPNTYLLLISYRSTNPRQAADVANAIADSYRQHSYQIRFRAAADLSTFMERQMEELRAKMERSSQALAQFEKELNVIDPDQKTSVLASRLLQLNTEFTTAQANTLRKQAAYDLVKDGSLQAAQASSQGDPLLRLAARVDEANEKFAIISAQYGPNHQEYKKSAYQMKELQRQFDAMRANVSDRVLSEVQQAQKSEDSLRKAVSDSKAEYDALNARSFEYKALKQEADTDKGLYEELTRKIKEAGINSNFQSSSIRLADTARPAANPVWPNIRLNALLAALFSLLLGVGVAILADTMDNSIRDPEQIQRELHTEVLGSLPVVKPWLGRIISAKDESSSTAVVRAGYHSGESPAAAFEEAIRTLRDSILLSNLTQRPRSLLITSATPREGKTTTTVHLAVAHSQQGRKTLLIDGDLRRPGAHTRIGLDNERGLSDVIQGSATWRDVIQKSVTFPGLDVISAGPASRRAADRVGKCLEEILTEAETEYDLVVVDAPPLLGFAEPLQMAAVVDGVVVVTLAGQTNRNAVANVLASLRRLKANVIGIALNEVRKDMSDRYYYYGYYGKYYSKYYKPTES